MTDETKPTAATEGESQAKPEAAQTSEAPEKTGDESPAKPDDKSAENPNVNPHARNPDEEYAAYVDRLAREGHIDRRQGTRPAAAAAAAKPEDKPEEKRTDKPKPKPQESKPGSGHWADRRLFGKGKKVTT